MSLIAVAIKGMVSLLSAGVVSSSQKKATSKALDKVDREYKRLWSELTPAEVRAANDYIANRPNEEAYRMFRQSQRLRNMFGYNPDGSVSDKPGWWPMYQSLGPRYT